MKSDRVASDEIPILTAPASPVIAIFNGLEK